MSPKAAETLLHQPETIEAAEEVPVSEHDDSAAQAARQDTPDTPPVQVEAAEVGPVHDEAAEVEPDDEHGAGPADDSLSEDPDSSSHSAAGGLHWPRIEHVRLSTEHRALELERMEIERERSRLADEERRLVKGFERIARERLLLAQEREVLRSERMLLGELKRRHDPKSAE